jgi:hypothetical protein
MNKSQVSVSIVCVYNRLSVRKHCLDRSIQALTIDSPDLEYLPIENVDGKYQSAGAALNYGVSLAKNDVVVFVHQDVYLHSLTALKDAAEQVCGGHFGVLGAIGVRADGLLLGRIRDRVLLAGAPVARPAEVDSVDEVLFMAPRVQLIREPLSESPDLAWHAYAVEYGLRIRREGFRTGVANIPITHNSLSVNLARLDEAHQAVAKQYTDLLPLMTTCGTIHESKARQDRPDLFASQRWRYRWLRDSIVLRHARKAAGGSGGVLADMRYDVDRLIACSPGRRLNIINSNDGRPFVPGKQVPLELRRAHGEVVFLDCAVTEIPVVLASLPPDSWTLVTNLSEMDLRILESQRSRIPSTLGYHVGTGLWLLFGPTSAELPDNWRSKRASPLGAAVVDRGIVPALRKRL